MNQSSPDPHQSSHVDFALPAGRIAFIQSGWHKALVDQSRAAFVTEFIRLGGSKNSIDFFDVPGAFEIPLQAKILSQTDRFLAVVCAGLVVDGGIYRHEFVGDAVISGLMRVQLDTQVPIISAVLTPQHFHEHDDHTRFFHAHLMSKGAEAARACAATIANIDAAKKLAA